MKYLYISVIFILTSCASTPANYSVDYVSPNLIPIDNEKIVDSDFDDVWDDLVGDLSKTFYVINNIDKQSRLLNVSFRITDGISNYVDCGVSDKKFSLASKELNSKYKVADSSSYFYEADVQTNVPNTIYYEVFRLPSLEGRANIYVAPSDNGTKVSVNSRYTWIFRGEYDTYLYMPLYNSHNRQNQVGRRQITDIVEPVAFNTNQIGGKSSDVQCVSTGKFENEILNLLNS